MAETVVGRDLSPFDDLTPEQEGWLAEVQEHVRASDHLVRLGETEEAAEAEDFVVYRDPRGPWQAGRYIGELALDGRRLEIRPRLGEVVIEQWLGEILNLIAVPETASRQPSKSFIARLMGAIWCRAVAQASRHGPPAIRREQRHRGIYVRGRLDPLETSRLRAAARPAIASIETRRDLQNDISRVMVAAERVLTQRIGHDHWRTPRVDELLPRLHEAVGVRPRLPPRRALERIRFTPITRPFKRVVDLSSRIARLEGFTSAEEPGRTEGLLLDVAELWELFVLNCIRRACPELAVEHGTVSTDPTWLLQSIEDEGLGLGRLKPDVLIRDGARVVAVVDAKYKRLQDRWPERPRGVDRGDLYQLVSYLSRYAPKGEAPGMLLYPEDPMQGDMATAEARGPWQTDARHVVRFERLPLEPVDATVHLRRTLDVDGP